MEINTQNAGDGSQNIQGESVTVNMVAVVVGSVKDIAPQVFNSAFAQLSEVSQKKAHANQDDFLKEFQLKLEGIAGDVEELKRTVEKPDFQYVAKKSLVAAGRMDSGEKKKLLASLLGDRLNTKSDFGEIVYNEALETIAKLTDRQIKMIALQCAVGQISSPNFATWDKFNDDKKELLSYLLPLNFQASDLQHISYSGCGTVSPFETDLIKTIRGRYGNLFLKPITSEEPLFDEIKSSPIIGLFYEKSNGLHFGANKTSFDKVIAQAMIMDKVLVEKIVPLFNSKAMNDEEALETLKTECFMGADLIDVWNTKQLKRLSLTSVGLIIGVSVIEAVTKKNIDKDEWLGLNLVSV